jgi:hypothetical protein
VQRGAPRDHRGCDVVAVPIELPEAGVTTMAIFATCSPRSKHHDDKQDENDVDQCGDVDFGAEPALAPIRRGAHHPASWATGRRSSLTN